MAGIREFISILIITLTSVLNSLDRAPKDNLRRIGTQCIVGGSYLRSTSPCGQNCSYGLEIDGPGYKCEDHANINSTALIDDVMGAFDIGAFSVPWTFVAAEDFAAAPYYKFSVQSSGLSAISSNTSCVAYKAWYKLNITYVNGVQNITAVSQLYDKLNFSQFWNDGSMYPSGGPGANAANVTLTNSTQGVMPVGSLVDLHYRSNIAAIKDALVVPLTGLIADEKGKCHRSYAPGLNGSKYPKNHVEDANRTIPRQYYIPWNQSTRSTSNG
jgi:hypothetical protein